MSSKNASVIDQFSFEDFAADSQSSPSLRRKTNNPIKFIGQYYFDLSVTHTQLEPGKVANG
jgi:hypothetical protein